MEYYQIEDQDGVSEVKVPKGKTLADQGYPPEVIATAQKQERARKPHEKLVNGKLVVDEAEKERARRARLLGTMTLGELEELIDARMAALDERNKGE